MTDSDPDSDSDPESTYVQNTSFRLGSVVSWAVSSDRVAMLGDDAVVHIVGDEDDVIEVANDVTDVALSSQLYTLGGDRIEAYALTGTRIWHVELPGAQRIVATEGSDFAVVLTDDDELVGLEATSGQERFRTERPHADVAARPEIVCTDELLVLSAWSFLSVLNPDGEVRTELHLDGAIDDHGVVGDTVVCSMKDGRFVGIDVESGDERWSHEWSVDRIDPFAATELLVQAEGELRSVTPDGSFRSLWADEGVPVAAAGGDPLCLVRDGVVRVYRTGDRSPANVSATLEIDRLTPEDRYLPFVLENDGTAAAALDVAVDVENVTVDDRRRSVTVPAGGRARVRFSVAEVRGDSARIELVAGEDDGDKNDGGDGPTTLLRRDLEIAQSGPLPSLAVDATLTSIDASKIGLDIAVHNDGDCVLERVTIDPVGESISRLEPGTTDTVSVRCSRTEPLEVVPEADAIDGETDRTVVVEPSELVSADPLEATVDVDEHETYLEVSIRNRTNVTVTDRVVVETDALGDRLDRSVTFDPRSAVTYLVPPVRSGSIDVHVESELLSQRFTVEIPRGVVADQRRAGRSSANGQADPTTAASAESIERTADEYESEPTVDRDRDSVRVPESESEVESEPELGPPSSHERAVGTGSGPATDDDPATDTADSSPLSMDRYFQPDRPALDHAFTEYVSIENRSERPIDLVLRTDDAEPQPIDGLEPRTRALLEREHVVLDEAGVTIPELVVSTGEHEERVPARTVTLDSPSFRCRGAITPAVAGEPVLEVGFDNRDRTGCDVLDVTVSGVRVESIESFEIPSRNTASRTIPIAVDLDSSLDDSGVVPIEYTVQRLGEGTQTNRTLAYVRSITDLGLSILSTEILEETVVDDSGGTIALEITNESSIALEDVTIAASGPHVRTIIYGEEEIDRLGSGAEHVHYVDIEPPTDSFTVPITISATVDGVDGSLEETLSVEGSLGGHMPTLSIDREDKERSRIPSSRLSTVYELQ